MAASLSPAQQVASAVAALQDADPGRREAANSWLAAFANEAGAWEAGVALLDPGQGSALQFFGANMVLVKVRSSWGDLTTEMQHQVMVAVRYTCAIARL